MQVYMKGGQYRGKTREDFFVEDGVRKLDISWFSNNKETKLTVIDPSGKLYRDFQISDDDGTWQEGGYIYNITINEPERGLWTMKAKSIQERYLLHVTFDSPLNDDIAVDMEKDELIHLYFSTNSQLMNLEKIHATAMIEYLDIQNRTFKQKQIKNEQGIPKMSILPFGKGIYNITVQITGETKKGIPFNRTLIESIYFGQ